MTHRSRPRPPTLEHPAGPAAEEGSDDLGRRDRPQRDEPRELLAPVLSSFWDQPESWTLDTYRRHEGYEGLRKALAMAPDDLIAYVKDSGLRGRGGAGFPTGMKWQFIPQGDGKPHYLVVNADESEPGTCKDIPLLFANPHSLIEGIVIACYAIRSSHAFIYLRGEVVPDAAEGCTRPYERRTRRVIWGRTSWVQDSIWNSRCTRARVRTSVVRKPRCSTLSKDGVASPGCGPLPAVAGLYACPTVVNNVESIASVPAILNKGKDWFKSMGSEKSPGFTLYSLSGHVTSPGQYEAPLGITLRQLLDMSGGMRDRPPAEVLDPGRLLHPDVHRGAPRRPPRLRGRRRRRIHARHQALQCFDETTCVVRAVTRWTEFYAHESCGKCTPCREGTYWLVQLLRDIEAGKGEMADLDKLNDIADNINGKSFCALGDGAASPIFSSLKYFREEYEQHITGKGCPFDPARSTAWADDKNTDGKNAHRGVNA